MIYSTLSHVSDLAKIGYVRAPGLLLGATAITLGGELARRGASVIAGGLFTQTVGRALPMDKIEEWSQEEGYVQDAAATVYKYSGLKLAYKFTSALKDYENKDLALGFAACVVWSVVHSETVNVILGQPHWGYNAVMKHFSQFRVASDSIVANLIKTGYEVKAWAVAQTA